MTDVATSHVLLGLQKEQVDACAQALRSLGARVRSVVPGACWLCDHVEAASAEALVSDYEATELCPVARWPRRPPGLVTFDMDSTLIEQEVIDELAREAGCYDKVAAITERAMRGELDFSESLALRVACLEGLPVEKAMLVMQRLTLSPGAADLVQALHANGVKMAILSGGFSLFAEPLARRLGIQEVRCNRLVVANGRLTGEVLPPVVDSVAKAEALHELADVWGLKMADTMAIGDGANDLRVLAASGMGIAWHAKPAVSKQADLAIRRLPLSAVACLFPAWLERLGGR